MNRVKKNKKKGFTLVELMIVVVIMVILAAAATPIFKGYLDRAKQAKYLAECRSYYIATQTIIQDYLMDDTKTLEDEVTINDGALSGMADDIQKLALVDLGADDTYTITIEDEQGKEACTKVTYTDGAMTVIFEPKKEVKVDPDPAG